MTIPDIHKFNNVVDFFNSFISENKAVNPSFSHSYFAERIKWPRTLLGDIASGRKPLSISRAVEFTQFFKLDLLKTERFILLCLAFKEPRLNDMIDRWFNLGDYQYPSKISNDTAIELSRSVQLTAVYDYLRGLNRLPPPEEVFKELSGINGLTIELIEKYYVWLREKGYICNLPQGEEALSGEPVFVQEVGMKSTITHTDYAMNLVRYYEMRKLGKLKSRSYVSSQFIKVPQSAHASFRARMIEFAEWAQTIESSLSPEDMAKSSLHQLDVNLFPVQEAEL